MAIKSTIWITTQFEGLHRWKDAPDAVAFLREWHRHVFHVKVGMPVVGLDREIEFFLFKRRVDDVIRNMFPAMVNRSELPRFEYSCEQIAALLLDKLNAQFVEVSEDGENGATAQYV